MEKTQIVVDVQASPLSELMQRKINRGKTNVAKNFTIFRTPHNISQTKKNLFEPAVISIGPFHRGKESLKAMEEHKWRFLESFLSRGDTSLDLCISNMKLLEETTRRCYSETFDDLDSNAFVEMMLLDGCFLLEFVLKTLEGNLDSIFEVGWNCNFINRDLLLLENQIPFFIVEKLKELIRFKEDARMIFSKYLALILLPIDSIFGDPPAEIPNPTHYTDPDLAENPDTSDSTDSHLAEIPDPPAEIHHLLHLFYHYSVPNPDKPVVLSSKSFTRMFSENRIIKVLLHRFRSRPVRRGITPHSTSRSLSVVLPNSTGNMSSVVIPSATELKLKGLKFRPKSKPRHKLDISFEYGVLKIPRLKIIDSTKSIFANLIAFEHSKLDKNHSPFASFVAFLDNLVNTPSDVRILQKYGIIENWLDSAEELANFINQVGECTGFGRNHYLAEIKMEINRYIVSNWDQSWCKRQRAKLIHEYFSSPWKSISVVAAFILLVLTCVQTFFAVYAYKFPPSS